MRWVSICIHIIRQRLRHERCERGAGAVDELAGTLQHFLGANLEVKARLAIIHALTRVRVHRVLLRDPPHAVANRQQVARRRVRIRTLVPVSRHNGATSLAKPRVKGDSVIPTVRASVLDVLLETILELINRRNRRLRRRRAEAGIHSTVALGRPQGRVDRLQARNAHLRVRGNHALGTQLIALARDLGVQCLDEVIVKGTQQLSNLACNERHSELPKRRINSGTDQLQVLGAVRDAAQTRDAVTQTAVQRNPRLYLVLLKLGHGGVLQLTLQAVQQLLRVGSAVLAHLMAQLVQQTTLQRLRTSPLHKRAVERALRALVTREFCIDALGGVAKLALYNRQPFVALLLVGIRDGLGNRADLASNPIIDHAAEVAANPLHRIACQRQHGAHVVAEASPVGIHTVTQLLRLVLTNLLAVKVAGRNVVYRPACQALRGILGVALTAHCHAAVAERTPRHERVLHRTPAVHRAALRLRVVHDVGNVVGHCLVVRKQGGQTQAQRTVDVRRSAVANLRDAVIRTNRAANREDTAHRQGVDGNVQAKRLVGCCVRLGTSASLACG